MKSTVRIENVGPIKFAEIDLQKYMVLIGEQASGKSTIAKVIDSLTTVSDIVRYKISKNIFIRKNLNNNNFLSQVKEDLLSNFLDIENFHSGKISYYFNDIETISYSYGNEVLFSNDFENAVNNTLDKINEAKDGLSIHLRLSSKSFVSELNELSYEIIEQNIGKPFFDKILTFLIPLENQTSDYLYLSSYTEFTIVLDDGYLTYLQIDDFLRKTIGGKYKVNRSDIEESFILLSSKGISIPVKNLSSGQKYSLIIFNYLKHYVLSNHSYRFIIEEPETHLFPAAQSDVTKAIITFANQPKKDNQVLITTHSPYVLSTINNLLYAGQLSEDKRTDIDKLRTVVPEHLWMKPSDFACYKVKDGVLEDLVVTLDSGIKQIDQEYIDSISNVLIDEMNQLILIDPNDE